jgi:hypothetical protein
MLNGIGDCRPPQTLFSQLQRIRFLAQCTVLPPSKISIRAQKLSGDDARTAFTSSSFHSNLYDRYGSPFAGLDQ